MQLFYPHVIRTYKELASAVLLGVLSIVILAVLAGALYMQSNATSDSTRAYTVLPRASKLVLPAASTTRFMPFATTTFAYTVGEFTVPPRTNSSLLYIPALVSQLAKGTKADLSLTYINLYYAPQSTIIAYTSIERENFGLSVNVPVFDSLTRLEKVRTIIHELSHVSSLQSGEFEARTTTCATVLVSGTCAKASSSIAIFNREISARGSNQVYVNTYASKNLLEDYAETAAYYATGFTTKNKALAKKVAYFAQVPDVVAMKKNASRVTLD